MAQRVTVYTAPSCTLCRHVLEDLELLVAEYDLEVRPVDITGDPRLLERYLLAVPVVEVSEMFLQAPISIRQLRNALAIVAGSTV